MNNFKQLGLSTPLLEVLESMGFTQPTPIQEKSIPHLLQSEGTDFIGLAQTGTGKTAAFGLPLIDLVDADNKATQALIMAPTRELGQQTAKQIVEFSSKYKSLNVEVVYGGAAITNQIKALKKPTQIVVATPGRLLDLIRRRAISLKDVRYVVLDEADEMLNMGFKEDIDDILSNIQEEHSTWLFSATMPPEIKKITKKYMTDPFEVSVNTEQKTNVDITHQYVVTRSDDKVAALRRFLDLNADMKGIMFCRTKRETQQITDDLSNVGYDVEALHGDLSQAQRDAAMKRFKSRNMPLLIATDVAARGLDVNDLTHVFHHKLPDQIEAYTHRSGRTGRAGKKGISICFINSREGRKISEIERTLKVTFEKVEVPAGKDLKAARIESWTKRILKMPVDEKTNPLIEELKSEFEALTKEDLLNKLLTEELKSLKKNDTSNLNVQESRSKSTTVGSEGPQRFFINIGKNDGLSKTDLLQFIVDISGTKRSLVGDIALLDKHSFFDIDGSAAKGFELKFEGLELESGHPIRVNFEGNRNQERGGGRKPRGKGGRSNFGGNRNRSGGGGGRGRSDRNRSGGGGRSRRRD